MKSFSPKLDEPSTLLCRGAGFMQQHRARVTLGVLFVHGNQLSFERDVAFHMLVAVRLRVPPGGIQNATTVHFHMKPVLHATGSPPQLRALHIILLPKAVEREIDATIRSLPVSAFGNDMTSGRRVEDPRHGAGPGSRPGFERNRNRAKNLATTIKVNFERRSHRDEGIDLIMALSSF